MAVCLAPVVAGWTGSIAVDSGGITTTITPLARDSIAAIMARLVHEVYVDQDLQLRCTVDVDNNGELVLAAASTFGLVASGTVATRTLFDSGPYSGAASYAASDTYEGRVTPAGVVYGGTLQVSGGRAVGDGSGGSHGVDEAPSGRLRTTWQFASAWSVEGALTGVYDVWDDGRILGRVRVDGWRRRPAGGLRTGLMILEATVTEVSE